ncbi:MAG TPA: hypothetical protein DCM71_03135 [Runella sp.]|nr:hypothetical protein [Runella sp.]
MFLVTFSVVLLINYSYYKCCASTELQTLRLCRGFFEFLKSFWLILYLSTATPIALKMVSRLWSFAAVLRSTIAFALLPTNALTMPTRLAYLRTLPYIQGSRIGLMGFSHGG